ncbi:orotate phosphoribosyltransferase [Paenibacillus baekrokdamisoli]|uniref:Orotate phosphoribosyltransferase n=1 Tax=Paenibacillus baekrokdamisoli TaxID=1712516 RepID=A0A3G9JFB8_9BACL|nr:orotate phosphoribosyltransferase [Paenibacillus baekrokdamisoli]BBH21854.1 orotate phosphoribosyltransferase [Paenibacillus baekrokdamisoli]
MARELYKVAHLTGTFTLRSGQVSNDYFDKYLFESDPRLLGAIAAELSTRIAVGTDVLAGLEMGGIPIATVLSMETNIPAAFVRKKAKEYGTCKLAEGADIKGKRVCVVEDVVTTGGQIISSVMELREAGAIVEEVVCVIERQPEGRKKLEEIGLKLHALFTMQELVEAGEMKG